MGRDQFDWGAFEKAPEDKAGGFDWSSMPKAEAPKEPSMMRKGLDYVLRGADYLGGLSRTGLANSPPGQTLDALQAMVRGKGLINKPDDVINAFKGRAPRVEEYVQRTGLPNASLSDAIPGIYTSTPEEANTFFRAKLAKGGLLDPTIHGTIGMAGDIATDPLSYPALISKLPGGLKKLGQVLTKPVGHLEAPLEEASLSATTKHLRPTPGTTMGLGREKTKEVAREVRDNALGFGAKAEKTAERVTGLKDETGQKIGGMIDASTQTVHPDVVAQQIEKEVIDPLRGVEANDDLVKSLERRVEKIKEFYGDNPMTARQVEEQKRAIQKHINYLSDPKPKAEAEMGLAHAFQEQGEKLITDPNFVPTKKKFGNLAAAEGMANRTAALTDGGTGLMGHLSDLGLRLEALKMFLSGNPAAGLIPLAREVTKGRISSAAAKTFQGLSKGAGRIKDTNLDALIRQGLINQNRPAESPWTKMQGANQ